MKILAIETSCDETAIAIVDAQGDEMKAHFRVLGNALVSQIDTHRAYGGVFPALAKREHAHNLVPVLEAALEEAGMLREDKQVISEETRSDIGVLLEREPELAERFFAFAKECEPPGIDAIAVTHGPGLEPALWVGVNFARALSLLWRKPLIPINHMEGHILSGLSRKEGEGLCIADTTMPVLALLISGGHTELILMREWLSYELIGQTRDDAVGEAFDKVARMLGLPYPGGPELSRLAESSRDEMKTSETRTSDVLVSLPRPMAHIPTCDFSFAGLKTAVLSILKKQGMGGEAQKKEIARAFEDAVADVLWKKTERALKETGARTLVLGGGVSANTHIRRIFTEHAARCAPHVSLHIPDASLTTDNAVMIALSGFYRASRKAFADQDSLAAHGNLSLA